MNPNQAGYFGGMILGSIDAAYAYEESLALFIRRRIALFDNPTTFWGRYRFELCQLDKGAKFPNSAYHYIPEDPLIVIPSPDLRIMLLKRRYLNRLRQTLMKRKRQGRMI